ncbi:unnamed protein product [Vicia faba]|uniref:Uncharacterized protein n=1 Tax=Vicia faba TaxID=3906 RepID=A0AAV1B749_VICFA|nr:unnamed protein product [Vicia faba]
MMLLHSRISYFKNFDHDDSLRALRSPNPTRVPDLGDFVATGNDQTVTKRRKAAEDDDNDSDKETERNKMCCQLRFFRVIALFSTVMRYLVKNGCA